MRAVGIGSLGLCGWEPGPVGVPGLLTLVRRAGPMLENQPVALVLIRRPLPPLCTSWHQTSLVRGLVRIGAGQARVSSCCCSSMQKAMASVGWWNAMMNESPTCMHTNKAATWHDMKSACRHAEHG